MVGVERIELSSVDYKSTALTFVLHSYLLYNFNNNCSTIKLFWQIILTRHCASIKFIFNFLLLVSLNLQGFVSKVIFTVCFELLL